MYLISPKLVLFIENTQVIVNQPGFRQTLEKNKTDNSTNWYLDTSDCFFCCYVAFSSTVMSLIIGTALPELAV